jgi:hypothetical protein
MDIFTREELMEQFQRNKDQAEIALKTAREYENSPAMHESGVSKFAHYLSLYYGFIFENEAIAKVLSRMEHN